MSSADLDALFEGFAFHCEKLERAQDPDANAQLVEEAESWAVDFLAKATAIRRNASDEDLAAVMERLRYDEVYVAKELARLREEVASGPDVLSTRRPNRS